MTHGTPPDSPATDRPLNCFRQLIIVALLSGAVAGLMLFAVQHWTIVPLIDQAEGFEEAARHATPASTHMHQDEGWRPASGFERIGLTALTTVLNGIGFGAILLAAMTLSGTQFNAASGALWGLVGFVCFVLAPALGLPPKPPGAAVADLPVRQLWWVGTVLATGAGLWLALRRSWSARIAGVLLLLLPHMIGAPATDEISTAPPELMQRFTATSVATNLLFWLVLGTMCGFLPRYQLDRQAAVAAGTYQLRGNKPRS